MSPGRRIVVTGVSGHWGAELARRLERDPSVEAVIGIDTEAPRAALGRTELIEADIRNPALARLLPTTEPDTVVHCGFLWYPAPGKPDRALHDINVVGTLQLLAACERTPTVRSVIARGSAAIYGCEGAAPFFFTEDAARRYPLKTRFQRDVGELERYFDNFAARHPNVTCCMLRFQPEIGPEIDTPLVGYLSLPLVPTQLGFDPRLQFVHSADATGALEAAVRSPVQGAVNVAPSGAVSLSRILRIADKPSLPIPHPLFGPALTQLGRHLRMGGTYDDGVRLLRYGRGVDNTRLLREVGYEPSYDAVEAVRDFAGVRSGRRLVRVPGPGSLARAAGAPKSREAPT